MNWTLRAWGIGVMALCAASCSSGRAFAVPLDAPACLLLGQEQKSLEQAGITADMQQGPDWAKANLAQDRLERVKHYLEVKEKVLFRCPSLVIAVIAATTPDAADGDATVAAGDDDGSAAIEQVPSTASNKVGKGKAVAAPSEIPLPSRKN